MRQRLEIRVIAEVERNPRGTRLETRQAHVEDVIKSVMKRTFGSHKGVTQVEFKYYDPCAVDSSAVSD